MYGFIFRLRPFTYDFIALLLAIIASLEVFIFSTEIDKSIFLYVIISWLPTVLGALFIGVSFTARIRRAPARFEIIKSSVAFHSFIVAFALGIIKHTFDIDNTFFIFVLGMLPLIGLTVDPSVEDSIQGLSFFFIPLWIGISLLIRIPL